jgi:hypothetical protein
MKIQTPKVPRGQWRVIRVNGAEEDIAGRPTIASVRKAIGADCLDTVNLHNGSVMMVDDTGMVDNKPSNSKATAIYHAMCKPGTVYTIHGDVALVNDSDFE